MAEVTGLTADPAQACPGQLVTFMATTNPSDETVFWDGLAFDAQIDGNTAVSRARSGFPVTASLGSSSLSVEILVFGLEVEVSPGPFEGDYAISAEPQMPTVTATATGVGAGIGSVAWEVGVSFLANDCPPSGPPTLRTDLEFEVPSTSATVDIDFPSEIRGGVLNVSARATVGGCDLVASNGAGVLGTNPDRTDVVAALAHNALRAIACWQSGQRQFDAPPDGGRGFCPLFRSGGRTGVMGLRDPTDEEVWNWRANVSKGAAIFEKLVAAAAGYPQRVAATARFSDLVSRFNDQRIAQGLVPLAIGVPGFTNGNFDDDLHQLELDAIRGYDGWHGQDEFGLELHEFRIGVDGVGDEASIRVADVDELAATGSATWERVPLSDRPAGVGDPIYVDNVVALLAGCGDDSTPQHTCSVEIVRGPSQNFSPPDDSGLARFTARLSPGCPADATPLWHVHRTDEMTGDVDIQDRETLTPTVAARRPNRAVLFVVLKNVGRLCLDHVEISVPQFFRVAFTESFLVDLERLGLRRRPPADGSGLSADQSATNASVERAVLDTILETARRHFRRVNVRFVTATPSAVPASSVTVATFGVIGTSPGSDPFGMCLRPGPLQPNQGKIDEGNLAPQQEIYVFTDRFTDRSISDFSQSAIYLDIFDELAIEDASGAPLVEGKSVDAGEHAEVLAADPQTRRRQLYVRAAVLAFGRFMGNVLAHEAGHALGLPHTSQSFDVMMDPVMTFRGRTGIDSFDPTTGEIVVIEPITFDQFNVERMQKILPILP